MRTSRVSQDAARVASLLSPRRSSRIQRTPSTASSRRAHTDDEVKEERRDDSDTEPQLSEENLTGDSSSSRKKRKKLNSKRPSPRKGYNNPATRKPWGEPPSRWLETYSITQEQRARIPAPVDTMGCASLYEKDQPPKTQRFQTLVALMLSSQTKDEVTSAAIWKLQKSLPGGLTLESVLAIPPEQLNELIGKVGFHNTKTKNIKAAAVLLRDKFGGDVPNTAEKLMELPGVGPKMAYLTLSSAWGLDQGIGVDVHVHRITNLWGWNRTKTPEETRAALESWLPKDKWREINELLVGFGQTVCKPVGRKCIECDVGLAGLCPSAVGLGKRGKGLALLKEKEVLKEEDASGKVKIKKEEELLTESDLKAEELDDQAAIQDIEDIGVAVPSRYNKRKR